MYYCVFVGEKHGLCVYAVASVCVWASSFWVWCAYALCACVYGVYVVRCVCGMVECIGGRCLLFKPLCLVCGVMFVYIARAVCVDVVSVGVVGIHCVCVCVYIHTYLVCVYIYTHT